MKDTNSNGQIPHLQERLSSIDQKLAEKTQSGNKESNTSNKESNSSHHSNNGGFTSNHFGGKSGPSLETPFNGVIIDPSTDSRVEMNLEAKDLYSQSKFKRKQ